MRDRQREGGLGTWVQRKERGWRDSGTRYRKLPALSGAPVQVILYPVRRLTGAGGGRGLVPGLPAASPTSEPQPGQPVCELQEPSRVGMDKLPAAATAPQAPGACPAQPGRHCRDAEVLGSAPIGRAFRSSACPPGQVQLPGSARASRSAAGAAHLDGLSLASRLPSTTAGTQLVARSVGILVTAPKRWRTWRKGHVSRLPGRWQVHFF